MRQVALDYRPEEPTRSSAPAGGKRGLNRDKPHPNPARIFKEVSSSRSAKPRAKIAMLRSPFMTKDACNSFASIVTGE